MHVPRIDLFDWLLQNAPKATYNLAYSNITGVTVEEYQKLTRFILPGDFDLGINVQYGAAELKDALSSMYDCEADNIVTTTGATEANFLVFSSLLSRGDEYIIEQPGYQPMWLTMEMLGARRINWPRPFENKFTFDLEALNNLFTDNTRLVILTNLHNPSGVLTDHQTIKTIAEIAADHKAIVLIDEIYLDGSFVSPRSSFGLPNVIVTSSATKIYGGGGLHTGWIIAPEDYTVRFQRIKAHVTGASSHLSEIMTAHLLKNARRELIQRFQNRAKNNLVVMKKWMKENTEFFTWVEPHGGVVCFPKYTTKMPSLALCKQLLEQQKVLINPGAYFNQDGHVRISYGCDIETVRSGLDAITEGMKSLQ